MLTSIDSCKCNQCSQWRS